jgi:type I restriction enzyme S subunit
MADEWQRCEVSQLMEDGKLVIGDGYRAKNDELASKGLPFARAGNINDGFRFDDADHFPEENLARVGNKVSQPGDVVFTSKGTVGRFAFVRQTTPRFVYSPQLCFWRSLDHEEIDPHFLYYWMFSREFFVQFKGVAGQTDMAEYVSLRDQRRMHMTLPSRDEQRAIAHILGTLDDKIELNRRMNETLEAMARAIFKSWFVDATQNGIPKGWKVAPIGDCVSVFGGSTPSTDDPTFWNGEIAFATPKDLASLTAPVLLGTERRITKTGLARISSGLLPRGTVLLSSRAPIGYLAISEIPIAVNQGFIAMVCDRILPNHYVLHWARQSMDVIIGNANGTTFLEISKRNFRPIPVIVPPPDVLEAFVGRTEPLYARIVSNLRESSTLAAIRDALLPKLLSGEIRVKDAEQIVRRHT